MADVGGPFDFRSYGYDGRGNRTTQVSEDYSYAVLAMPRYRATMTQKALQKSC